MPTVVSLQCTCNALRCFIIIIIMVVFIIAPITIIVMIIYHDSAADDKYDDDRPGDSQISCSLPRIGCLPGNQGWSEIRNNDDNKNDDDYCYLMTIIIMMIVWWLWWSKPDNTHLSLVHWSRSGVIISRVRELLQKFHFLPSKCVRQTS